MHIITPATASPSVRFANHFACVDGTAWGPRTIPDIELILIVSGTFVYESDETRVELRAGEILTIMPEVRHVFRHQSGHGVISCIHFELWEGGTWLSGTYSLEPSPPLVTRPTEPETKLLQSLFMRCADEFGGIHRHRTALLRTITGEIWLRLSVHWDAHGGRSLAPRTEEMVAYLRRRLHQRIGRTELAKVFGLAPQHVNAIFKKELGVSPTQLVHRELALEAMRLMQADGLSVKETAERLGFHDQFHFSRVFRKVTGMRPSRAR